MGPQGTVRPRRLCPREPKAGKSRNASRPETTSNSIGPGAPIVALVAPRVRTLDVRERAVWACFFLLGPDSVFPTVMAWGEVGRKTPFFFSFRPAVEWAVGTRTC